MIELSAEHELRYQEKECSVKNFGMLKYYFCFTDFIKSLISMKLSDKKVRIESWCNQMQPSTTFCFKQS